MTVMSVTRYWDGSASDKHIQAYFTAYKLLVSHIIFDLFYAVSVYHADASLLWACFHVE